MANEFKIKKGLIVTGASGGTVVDIQGSQGQLFSVTDDLSGSIFAVSDISGVPIFDVNSSGLSTFNGLVSGITPVNAANFVTKAYVDGSGGGTGPFLPLAGGTLTGAFYAQGSLPTTPGMSGTGIGLGQASNYAHAQFSGSAGGYIDFSEPNVDWSGRIIYTHSSDSMVFYTAATTVLTLDSSNNATFTGNVLAEGSLITRSVNANLIISGDTSGNIYYNNASGEHRWRANGSSVNSMNLSSSLLTVNENATFTGNVGIGTTSPGAKLEVEGDATGDDTPQLIVASGGADNNAIIHFTDDAGSQVNAIGALEGNTLTLASQNELVFKTNTSSILGTTDTRMIIDTNGNVGIGTTSPGALLEVFGTGNSFRLDSAANGSKEILFRNVGTGTATIKTDGDLKLYTEDANKNILFETNGGERMRITSGGNVGIGTTTFPTTAIGERELLVQGAIVSKPPGVDDYYSYLKSNWADDGAFELGIQGADTNHKFITSSNYYHGTQLNFHTQDQKRMVIDTNGDVGIGTTLPKAKLDVNGHFCVDSKAHTITNAFTTCLTVNLTSHTGCYVTLTCFGDWPSHSSAAYRGEFFLQNGDNGYAEPGIILRQDDNTSDGTDQIVCQIVDPTGSGNPKNFEIQIRHTDTTSPDSWTGQLTYTVQGKFNSIT
jgi:hypothetical protein